MEQNGDHPPLVWPQFESVEYRRRRSSVSAFFSPPAIILTYTVAFLLISIFIVPPFLSFTSQILRPISMKKSWDSINVFLVLFAILCGVFARRNDDASPSPPPPPSDADDQRAITGGSMNAREDGKISSPLSQQWYSDVYAADGIKLYESVRSTASSPVTGTVRLRRSSTSYPDLRQGFFSETTDHHFRSYDDFEIGKYRSQVVTNSDSLERIQIRREIRMEESEPKEIPVDKFEVKPPSPAGEPPAPPAPPPSQAEIIQKPRRKHRSVRSRGAPENARQSESDHNSTKSKQEPASEPPPPPPPPPPPAPFTPPRTALRYEAVERKQGRLERRKSNAAKEIKMVFASLYNQRKRKRKLQIAKNKQRNESPATEPPHYQSTIPPPSPSPPPPPPPPPRSSQSVFYGLFKKGSKSKKVHSVPAPPPPPPPPPPSSRTSNRNIQFGRSPPPPPPPAPSTPPRRRTGKPPLPAKTTNIYEENYGNSGQESPLRHIPPPPPPPPFRVPPLKFVVSGDFAKIQSNQSSRCSSPEREVIDLGWGLELTQSEGGEGIDRSEKSGGRNFCPSPDVNTKADSFIARLRGEWRLEKINSVNEKRKLGFDRSPI